MRRPFWPTTTTGTFAIRVSGLAYVCIAGLGMLPALLQVFSMWRPTRQPQEWKKFPCGIQAMSDRCLRSGRLDCALPLGCWRW